MQRNRSAATRRRGLGRVVPPAAAAALTVVLLLVVAPTVTAPVRASAASTPLYPSQNVSVTSFDGTKLNVYFFPATGLKVGQTAPTVLVGSGWPIFAYPGWLPTVGTVGPVGIDSFGAQLIGPQNLEDAGYNVITWDNRGFWSSGGQVSLDSPDVEGRDVTAIINWLATQPAAELRGPDYPVVGMTGVSYGGGIQLSAAAVDHRIAAIEPNMSWYSLVQSLLPGGVIKTGWGDILCITGELTGARYSAEVSKLCASAQSGVYTPDEVAYGAAASPGPAMGKITTPTLLLGGTADTLFPLEQDVSTYDALFAAGTPVQMLWYCGGHGLCSSDSGPADYVIDAEMNFLAKYLKGENVPTGAGFQYVDQTGTWHSAPSYPLPPAGHLRASGRGFLGLDTSDTSGALGIEATPAKNGLDIPVDSPPWPVEAVGAPTLTLSYRGLGTEPTSAVFAQLVDTANGTVLGSQATAIPVNLDGNAHTVTLPLNIIAWAFTPGSKVELQLTDDSNLFEQQGADGALLVSHAAVSIPLVQPGTPS